MREQRTAITDTTACWPCRGTGWRTPSINAGPVECWDCEGSGQMSRSLGSDSGSDREATP